jgi:hypothetical protein
MGAMARALLVGGLGVASDFAQVGKTNCRNLPAQGLSEVVVRNVR